MTERKEVAGTWKLVPNESRGTEEFKSLPYLLTHTSSKSGGRADHPDLHNAYLLGMKHLIDEVFHARFEAFELRVKELESLLHGESAGDRTVPGRGGGG
jgi:hypothetical protein